MTHDISYLFRYHEVTDRIHKSGKSSIPFPGRLQGRRSIKSNISPSVNTEHKLVYQWQKE